MDKIVIRKISIEDLHGLQKISRQTFQEAFAQDNSEANMQKYLDANLSESQLTVELFDPQSEFYFAELGMDVLGYMKLNKGSAQTEQLGEEGLEIERIYVLSKCYGLGVGAALYNKALEIAKAKNSAFIWLGVWEHNRRAIRFYEKNGFVEFDKHSFLLGEDLQTDIMMKLKLTRN